MFGIFDSPLLKAHRKAAHSARSMRELAGRELSIELQMLARRLYAASGQRDMAFAEGKKQLAGDLTLAIGDGQDIMDRVGYSTDAILQKVSGKWAAAGTATQFEAITSYEVNLRSMLISIRDQARIQLTVIGEIMMRVDRR